MKWTLSFGAAALMLGISASAPAGLLGGLFSSGSQHEGCCPTDARPVACRPCEKTYTYQRELSNLRPPCCGQNGNCVGGPNCVGDPSCVAPCNPGCLANGNNCNRGWSHRKSNLLGKLCDMFTREHQARVCSHGPGCTDPGCTATCGPPLEYGDPCEIAELIYAARTSCYAKDRARAVHKLGKFDCRCHPEIMATLVYSLNDASEDVRSEAADEIGDYIEDGRCCCSPEVVAALTCTLGDCDRGTRRQAEEALELCGYRVVEGCYSHDGCCPQGGNCCHTGNGCVNGGNGCVNGGCNDGCCNTGADCVNAVPRNNAVAPAPVKQSAPAPAANKSHNKKETVPAPPAPEKPESDNAAPAPPAPAAAPAPAPPEDAQAYFPSRYRR